MTLLTALFIPVIPAQAGDPANGCSPLVFPGSIAKSNRTESPQETKNAPSPAGVTKKES